MNQSPGHTSRRSELISKNHEDCHQPDCTARNSPKRSRTRLCHNGDDDNMDADRQQRLSSPISAKSSNTDDDMYALGWSDGYWGARPESPDSGWGPARGDGDREASPLPLVCFC